MTVPSLFCRRGQVCWAQLPTPQGSAPGFRRPVLIVSSDAFNGSGIRTVVALSITSNLDLEAAPGNVPLAQEVSGLPRDSIINVSQVLTLNREFLDDALAELPTEIMSRVNQGLALVLDLIV